jgi:hypothetical protein
MISFKITKQLLAEATGRQLAAVILLAALGLAGPLPVRAQITPVPVPDGDPLLGTVFGTVPATSTASQSAITGGGDVAGALTTYNNAVSAAAHNISPLENVVPPRTQHLGHSFQRFVRDQHSDFRTLGHVCDVRESDQQRIVLPRLRRD